MALSPSENWVEGMVDLGSKFWTLVTFIVMIFYFNSYSKLTRIIEEEGVKFRFLRFV